MQLQKEIVTKVISSIISVLILSFFSSYLVTRVVEFKNVVYNHKLFCILWGSTFFIIGIVYMKLALSKMDRLEREMTAVRQDQIDIYSAKKKSFWFTYRKFYFEGYLTSSQAFSIDLHVYCKKCKTILMSQLTVFPWFRFYCARCNLSYNSSISYYQLIQYASLAQRSIQREKSNSSPKQD